MDSGSLLVLNLGGLDLKALLKDGLVERRSLNDCCDMPVGATCVSLLAQRGMIHAEKEKTENRKQKLLRPVSVGVFGNEKLRFWKLSVHRTHQISENFFNVRPSDCETIAPMIHPPNEDSAVQLHIADSREESKEEDAEDKADVHVYSDGSGIEGMAGAAAVLFRDGQEAKSLRYQLGPLTWHTTYNAEVVRYIIPLLYMQQWCLSVRATLRRGHSYTKILRDRGEPNRRDTLTQW